MFPLMLVLDNILWAMRVGVAVQIVTKTYFFFTGTPHMLFQHKTR